MQDYRYTSSELAGYYAMPFKIVYYILFKIVKW